MQTHPDAARQALKSYLETRRSVPALQMCEPGPDRPTIETMLTMAARVPDHGKLSPWRFIVISGDARARIGEKLLEIAKSDRADLSAKEEEIERERLTRAPVVITIVSSLTQTDKIPAWEQELSAGALCLNLFMAANAHGFAANWLTEWYAFDERARALFDLAEGERIAGFMFIGSTEFTPADRPRPDVPSLTTYID